MSIIFPETKPFKHLKHNGKVRDLGTVENQEIASKINEQVEIMIRHKAHSQVLTSLRARMTVNNSIYKEYAKTQLISNDIYTSKTSLGELKFVEITSISRNNKLIEESLKIDIENLISELPNKTRYVVTIETTALKVIPEVIDKVAELLSSLHSGAEKVSAENHTNKIIVSMIHWIKENKNSHSQYVRAYNRAKEIFSISSTVKLFPRIYSYKGVIFNWEDICFKSGLYARTSNALKAYDIKVYDEFEKTLLKMRENTTRIKMSLDEYDFTETQDLDEGYD